MQLPNTAAGSGSPDRIWEIHHRMDELLAEEHIISDSQATSTVKGGTKHARSLSCLLSHLINRCQQGKPLIKGHPKITSKP
jgi:hypothetical protein